MCYTNYSKVGVDSVKNKGFTLVELLGVIIILSVLVLITVVSTNGTVNSSKNKLSNIQIDQIETAAQAYHLKEGMESSDQRKTCVNLEYLLENGYMEGTEISDPTNKETMKGSVNITYKSNQYIYEYQESICSEEDLGIICKLTTDTDKDKTPDTGDVVTCITSDLTQSFYVMPPHEKAPSDSISMITMYNLNVGDNANETGEIGVQNKYALGGVYNDLGEIEPRDGGVPFSKTASYYWTNIVSSLDTDINSGNFIEPPYVYNNNSNLYPYLQDYKQTLEDMYINITSIELPTIKQLETLGCTLESLNCSSSPAWVYSSAYWLGSLSNADNVYVIYRSDVFQSFVDNKLPTINNQFGVRPVIILPKTEIK